MLFVGTRASGAFLPFATFALASERALAIPGALELVRPLSCTGAVLAPGVWLVRFGRWVPIMEHKVVRRCPSSSVMLHLAISGEREMESYRLPFFAVIVLWLLPIQAIAAERPVLGQGNISCSLWLEGRQTDSPNSASRTGWILGFMSAFNQYGLQSQGADVSEGKNTDELMGWVDNYCRQHQGDDLHTASEAFIDDFRQRTRR